MKQRYVQVGTIGIRNPANRYEIHNVPIYETVTPEIAEAESNVQTDISKLFAAKMKHYIDAGALTPYDGGNKDEENT